MHRIIEQLTPRLRAIAYRLSVRHADDLLSEMHLAIIVAGPGQKDAFYVRRAKDRARNYLKAERRRAAREALGGVGLSRPTRAYLHAAAVDIETDGTTWTFMTLGAVRSDSTLSTPCAAPPNSGCPSRRLLGAA